MIRGDATQILQVLMNMCVNAKDALTGEGTITLTTANVTVDSLHAARWDAEEGDYVRICVRDDGEGIPPDILERIFEPFFTTKDQGKGTGLGLATSYGIVQQHGGWIECTSEVGEGTMFSVFLPRISERIPARREEAAAPQRPAARIGGTETILLVDDEPPVRFVAESVLRHHGYAVLTADDGLRGIEAIRENGDRIAMVLLDLTMPKLSGKETFGRIKELRPDVPVVICSGYLLNEDDFRADTGFVPDGYVQKPYDLNRLVATVREVIDSKGAVTHADTGLPS